MAGDPETSELPADEAGLNTSLLELPEGRRALIRSVRPGDKDLIATGFRQLSPESRYMRFFANVSELSPDVLAYLTEIDHRDHEALIAIDPATGFPLGVARYVRLHEEPMAEVAVAVRDDWHGRGLGTALLRRLADYARDQGITHFVARMLPENEKAHGLLHAAEHVEVRDLEDGKIEAVIQLPADEGIGPGLATALGAAAIGLLHGSPREVLRGLLGQRPPSA